MWDLIHPVSFLHLDTIVGNSTANFSKKKGHQRPRLKLRAQRNLCARGGSGSIGRDDTVVAEAHLLFSDTPALASCGIAVICWSAFASAGDANEVLWRDTKYLADPWDPWEKPDDRVFAQDLV